MVGENRVSLSHIDRMSGLGALRPPCHKGPYVLHNNAQLLCGFSGTTSFSLNYPPILRLLGLLGTP
jgi:hypothetical protein